MSLSRRQSLKWLAAAVAVIPSVPAAAFAQTGVSEAPHKTGLNPLIKWPDLALPVNAGTGYGSDPDIMDPSVPWPLILPAGDKAALNLLGDIILPQDDASPGAGQLDIAAFIDEWVSSPYESQAGDRLRILSGLRWLDDQSRWLCGKTFIEADTDSRTLIIDALMRDPAPDFLIEASSFFSRLRGLIVGGYYTLPEGKTALGYIGNSPFIGPYPGPDDAALGHLRQLLASLNLPHSA